MFGTIITMFIIICDCFIYDMSWGNGLIMNSVCLYQNVILRLVNLSSNEAFLSCFLDYARKKFSILNTEILIVYCKVPDRLEI